MIAQAATLALVATAAWMISTDPAGRFHPNTHTASTPVSTQVASIQTDAQIAFAARYMRMLPKGVK